MCWLEMSSCLCPQDVDDFFQNERDQNLVLTGSTKTAAEVNQSSVTPAHPVLSWSVLTYNCFFIRQKFLDVVQTEQSKNFF